MPNLEEIKPGDIVKAKWFSEMLWYTGRVVLYKEYPASSGTLCIKIYPQPSETVYQLHGLASIGTADVVIKLG